MNYNNPAYELALQLMGKNPRNDDDFDNSEDDVDEWLYQKYGIEDSDKFHDLVRDLAKLADRQHSELSGTEYSGFALREGRAGFWLFKVQVI